MDSGNSGSMQSSSGGDEDYDDSRGESISTFLNNSSNNNSLAHFGSISSHNNNNNNSNPSFLSHHHQQHNPNNTFFDTAASLFPQSSNPPFNTNDLIWSSSSTTSSSRALRSDQNLNFISSAPSSNVSASGQLFHHPNQNPFPGSSSLQAMQQPSMEPTSVVRASSSAQPDQQPNVAKNPKKRTRASRRAPTTVLTTDTTNFRQMVQEFTGIPTAPFTGSPYTRRLDLFSTAGSGMRTGHLDSLGPLYPLRPSAQKVQLSPFMSQLSSAPASSLSSSMIDALMPGNNNSIVGTTSGSTSTSTNFQLGNSNHVGIQKQAQNLFNMQNQILSFNTGSTIFNTKSSGGGSLLQFRRGSVDEFIFEGPKLGKLAAVWISPESGQWRLGGMNVTVISLLNSALIGNEKNLSDCTAIQYDFDIEDVLLGEKSDSSMIEFRPCSVTEFSEDNIISLSEKTSPSSSVSTQNISNEDTMKEYTDLKLSLLVYDAILTIAGSSIAFLAGDKSAIAFLTGGIVGFFYLLLVQRSVDGIPSSELTQSNRTETLDQTDKGFKGSVLNIALALAVTIVAAKYALGDVARVLTPQDLMLGTIGFLLSKVSVILAAFVPITRGLRENK